MIRASIDAINERIADQLTTDKIQVGRMAIAFQDQQENATSLRLIDENRRLTMNSKLLWQSAHLTDGSRVIHTNTFGSFTDHTHQVRFILIGLSKAKSGMDVAMRALDGTGYVVVDSYEDDTLTVLTRYWRVKTGQDNNYDPDLFAFAIRYHIDGVTDEDFAEMPDEVDLAQLPVQIVEAEPVEVPGSSPDLPRAYRHTQGAAASVWLVVHNLGFYPAGIKVLDSADEEWIPQLEYIDINSLRLSFGTASFAGEAFIS